MAPDNPFVDRAIEPVFLDALTHWIRAFHSDDPYQSPDYARIINTRHFQRLSRLTHEDGGS